MKKKIIIALIFLLAGGIMLIGAIKMLPDLRAMGVALALLFVSLSWFLLAALRKERNKIMLIGGIIVVVALVGLFGATGMLPDKRPIFFMAAVLLVGLFLWLRGLLKGQASTETTKMNWYNLLYGILVVVLFGISIVLIPTINWSWPKDPAAVMILSFLTALGLIYAKIKKHPAQKPIFFAGIIFVVNFALVRVYEAGVFDFLGQFYRLFVPLYAAFDKWAQYIEWVLIALSVVLLIVMLVRKVKISNLGQKSLYYFILQPVMAIFFFEMLGLPAGFLSGLTTRSDLLVTNTNAVMSTFGMVFIAIVMYILFELFPAWVAAVVAGLWWVFWKPWLLHHPDPAMFKDLASFLPAAAFLFFTGLKRIVLPMGLLALFMKPKSRV
jgi:hypothetical protein